jgi:hypothetical protein
MKPFKIQYEDKTYTFDIGSVSANDWRAVRNYCGCDPFDLFEALGTAKIEAVEATFWLVMRQASEPSFDFGQRSFGLLAFLEGWNQANADAAKDAEEVASDPKAPESASGSAPA